LYLPKERAADDERREQAELHKETGFQTKPEVALDGIRGMEIVLETTECA
jgi:SRSO17 transposase